MKSVAIPGGRREDSTNYLGEPSNFEADPFLWQLSQSLLKVTAVSELTDRIQFCPLDTHSSFCGKTTPQRQKINRYNPYMNLKTGDMAAVCNNMSVPPLGRIRGSLPTVPAPGRPPRWWTLVPDYRFVCSQNTSFKARSPPKWWSLQQPDDCLYDDELCEEKKDRKSSGCSTFDSSSQNDETHNKNISNQ